MRKLAFTAVLLTASSLTGCNLAPGYKQPEVVMPPTYAAFGQPMDERARKLATDVAWREFFVDERLKALIELALVNNRDLAQSMARVAQARAQYRIQASQRLPEIDANGGATRIRQPLSVLGSASGSTSAVDAAEASGVTGVQYSQYTANVGVSSFELDLWGRVRNMAEGERNRYLASEQGARQYRLSLIAQVAATYYDILAGQERLDLAGRTLEGRREGVRIAKLRLDAGVTSTVDYDQTVLLQTQTETEIAQQRQTLEQKQNLLNVLIGGPLPDNLPASRPFSFQQQIRPVEPGLPSTLLTARPDILQAEYQLRGANADIGAARAAFFPTISLTAAFGFASPALNGLFDTGNQSWNYGGSVSLPIFDWGRRAANVKLTRAKADELTASYQRTVQGAFQEVADALVARRRLGEQVLAVMRTVEAQTRLAHAARLRYDNGIAIYLEVLDAERNLFTAEQQLIALRATALQNGVSLYTALGGGVE
ncbi:MAG TPA: efflux transporter outer membrane subunit [Sphingobium sp.]|uniref:efflux transporter outer membrane subunit n=1 Tax=Sphingobium sp. TaxID=1912891 RepID=UPI002ED2D471